MALIDADQRSQATSPVASFIVQAPAGSGKTEILTQRYLRLLSTVTAPEQIIALTFTRKAASEMRQRIILALQAAASNQEASSSHQQMTFEFARAALKRSEQFQWNLEQQTNRLKICTLDALCQSINQAIPLLEKHLAFSSITDTVDLDYLHASRACIQFALEKTEYHQDMKTLLLHVDNRQDRLLHFFTDLLSQRDRWISLLFYLRDQDKSTLEELLSSIEEKALARFRKSLPRELANQLIECVRQLATLEGDPSCSRYLLRDWYTLEQTTAALGKALAKLLLTGEQQFRKSFDHHVGLKRDLCSKEEYDALKGLSKTLLAQLSECSDCLPALIQVSQLPKTQYDEDQWAVLQALFRLLPLLLSHLQVHFCEKNRLDFITVSQQALAALGDFDNPSDLALYLDTALHHILVDEFQDTSLSQFEFIKKLVQGWQPDEGKTLFIVGDPMQSIYRFRQAEVGLFFQAKEEGIGPVRLQSLQLQANFRSTKPLVSWVNQHFVSIFPKESNIGLAAVSFHPSTALLESQDQSPVFALQFKSKEQEAQYLLEAVVEELKRDEEQSIAILVRSRSQLTEIIRSLRKAQIPYQGSEMDLLSNFLHVRDALSMTQALLSPANRLSWLALLRSPYCGMPLRDILCIASHNKKQSIYDALLHIEQIQGLSEEGRLRAHYFSQVMQEALNKRYQMSLSDWVAQTLKHLHMDRILDHKQMDDLEQFWALLDLYEKDGFIADWNAFTKTFNELYSQQVTPSRLQIMTIHKSKGLEFDTVFLPGLGAQSKSLDSPLLRWHQEGNEILVSAIQAADKEHCDLYDYLGRLEEEKAKYESQRLLYVAVTRAKSRLYLLDGSSKTSKNSFVSLLKNQEFKLEEQLTETEKISNSLPMLVKLPLNHYEPFSLSKQSTNHNSSLSIYSSIPRLTGILSHRLMQWICDQHPLGFEQIPWQLVLNECKQLGFDKQRQEQVLANLKKQLGQVFQDPRGLWIIKKQCQEQNEQAFLVEKQGQIVTRIMDRCFVENDTQWIIDFKTGRDDATHILQYQEQLNEYRDYLSRRSPLKIRCGLYFLNNRHWLEWS